VIAAIMKEAYDAREKYWSSIGFVGRCIPVSFYYSEKTKLKIHEHIRKASPSSLCLLQSPCEGMGFLLSRRT
jgi:hypothetical protein